VYTGCGDDDGDADRYGKNWMVMVAKKRLNSKMMRSAIPIASTSPTNFGFSRGRTYGMVGG
jgi:hypothetical protein